MIEMQGHSKRSWRVAHVLGTVRRAVILCAFSPSSSRFGVRAA